MRYVAIITHKTGNILRYKNLFQMQILDRSVWVYAMSSIYEFYEMLFITRPSGLTDAIIEMLEESYVTMQLIFYIFKSDKL